MIRTHHLLLAVLFAFSIAESHAMRWYSSSTGRWLSRDPIAEKGGLNLYGFVANNPIQKVDHLGLYFIDAGQDARLRFNCKLNLDYDFIPKADLSFGERLNQPIGVNYVTDMQQILDDIKKQIPKYDSQGNCCKGKCISKLTISSHGRALGVMPLGPGEEYNPSYSHHENKPAVDPGVAPNLAEGQADFIRAKAFMQALKAKMCTGSKISFVVCGAGAGDPGQTLRSELETLFGPGIKVEIFSGNACYTFGQPTTTTIKK